METTDKKKKITDEKGMNLLKVKIKRVENGVMVWVKSPRIEALFTEASDCESRPYRGESGYLRGISYYSVRPLLPIGAKGDVSSWGEGLFANCGVNLSLLRTQGLGEGIAVFHKGLYTRAMLTEWVKGLTEGVKFLYTHVLAPTEIEVDIIVRDAE